MDRTSQARPAHASRATDPDERSVCQRERQGVAQGRAQGTDEVLGPSRSRSRSVGVRTVRRLLRNESSLVGVGDERDSREGRRRRRSAAVMKLSGSGSNRIDYELVAGTTAQVPGNAVPDLIVRRLWVVAEQLDRG